MDLENIVVSLAKNKSEDGQGNLIKMVGGHSNHVWRYKGAQEIVLKKYLKVPQGSLFENSLQEEEKALKTVKKINIAPKFVKSWPDLSIIAYRYVEGIPWQNDIKAVAELILEKERINPEKFKEVSCEPEELLKQGDVFLAKCQKLPKVKRPHPEQIPPLKKFSLLHRDIRQNLISEFRGGIKLIDWQTPAKGDICEDIFSFISPGFQILANGTPFSAKDFNSFWKFVERPDLYERYRKIRAAFAWRHGSYCWWKSTIVESKYLRTKYRSASLAEFDYSTSNSL